MRHFLFVVRDKKLGAYDVPFCKREDVEHVTEMIARGLKDIPVEQLGKARDFALYHLGYYDDIHGKFELLEQPEKLLDYEDYVPRVDEVDKHGKA